MVNRHCGSQGGHATLRAHLTHDEPAGPAVHAEEEPFVGARLEVLPSAEQVEDFERLQRLDAQHGLDQGIPESYGRLGIEQRNHLPDLAALDEPDEVEFTALPRAQLFRVRKRADATVKLSAAASASPT